MALQVFQYIAMLLALYTTNCLASGEILTVISGDIARLPCNAVDEDFSLLAWILPNSTIIQESSGILTASSSELPAIDSRNGTLLLSASRPSHSGRYICFSQFGEQKRSSYVDLVVAEEFYNNPIAYNGPEDNLSQLVNGAVASAVGIVVLGVGCFIYKFRWKPLKSDVDISSGMELHAVVAEHSVPEVKKIEGCDNEIFNIEEHCPSTSPEADVEAEKL